MVTIRMNVCYCITMDTVFHARRRAVKFGYLMRIIHSIYQWLCTNCTHGLVRSLMMMMTTGRPSFLVFDCSCAGNIVKAFAEINEAREHRSRSTSRSSRAGMTASPSTGSIGATGPQTPATPANPTYNYDIIVLAACGAKEILPVNPELPVR